MKRTALAAALLLLALPAQAAEIEIGIDNFTFAPAERTVRAGDTVVWINRDDIPHAIALNDRSFRSPVIDSDERTSFTFARPGKYPYFCPLHPHMTGTITVTP